MNPQESAVFTDFVYRIRDERDLSVLLIEHDMSVVMRVSERITVLDRGEMIAEGSPDDIRTNERVVEAYLGKSGSEQSELSAARRAAEARSAGTAHSDAPPPQEKP
jgi:branched-chain amino acid transport system ATP-binding protein